MKKSVLLVFVFCFSFVVSFSQTYDWVWARSSTSGYGEGISVATNKSDNVFITGYYEGTITFGSYLLATTSSLGAFYLTKYDSYGNLKWAKGLGLNTGNSSRGWSVCTDLSSNSYVTGYFRNMVSFGSDTLISAGNGDVFLVKYDSIGNVLWARSAGGIGDDQGYSVITDRFGNVYITGYFDTPSITFGSYTLVNAGTFDIFLTKYDSLGNVLWAKSAGGNSDDRGHSVATDDLGNIYMTGYFYSSSIIFGSYTLTNAGEYDIFLAKYDSSGNVLWAKSAGGNNYDQGLFVATDPFANAYITGYFASPTITFGSYALTNAGNNEAFLAKYDSSGNVRWAKSIIGSSTGCCITTYKSNRIYVSGNFTSSALTFDTITVLRPAVSNDPMYVAGCDSSGHALLVNTLGSGGDDWNSVAAGPSGCLYIGGDFEGVNPFIFGNDSLHLSGAEDIFVAKLCYSGITSYFTSTATNICAEGNNCINFSDFSTGNPTSWQWHFPGAMPDTSSQQNPTQICYGTPGTYPVTLIVANSSGSDTLTVSPMITVGGTPPPPTISQVGDTLYSSHASSYQWYLNGSAIAGATDSFYVASSSGTYSVQITDGNGCISLSAGIAVGIDELGVSDLKFEVYPNPANSIITVSLRGTTCPVLVGKQSPELEIYNVLGVKVYSAQLRTANSGLRTVLNVSSLSDGVYFLKIESEGATVNRKFVVVKK